PLAAASRPICSMLPLVPNLHSLSDDLDEFSDCTIGYRASHRLSKLLSASLSTAPPSTPWSLRTLRMPSLSPLLRQCSTQASLFQNLTLSETFLTAPTTSL